MTTLSELILKCQGGAANNPYQGNDKKVLFVCSMGILRSATAARLYAREYNTRAAGAYRDALVPLSPILMAWADEIVFVDVDAFIDAQIALDWDGQAPEGKIIKILDIPDRYEHMSPQLIDAFEQQYKAVE